MNRLILSLILLMACSGQLWAEPSLFDVPMHSKGANTFYISGKIGNMAPTEFMVDTGSSYMTINENTLAELQAVGNPRYLRDLKGVLANGAEMLVPVYTITDVLIGEKCLLEEVEVAVFPGQNQTDSWSECAIENSTLHFLRRTSTTAVEQLQFTGDGYRQPTADTAGCRYFNP